MELTEKQSLRETTPTHSLKKFETTEIFDYFPAIHSRADYPRYVPARCEKKKKKSTLFDDASIEKID